MSTDNTDSSTLTGEIQAKVDEIVNETVSQGSKNAPEDVYAGVLYIYGARFKASLNQLSSRQLRRLIDGLLHYPLNLKEYKATSQVERDALLIGDAIIQAKAALMLHHEMTKEENNNEQTTEQPKETP